MSASLALMGAAVGLTHALEPDHLAAVSALVAREQRPRQALGLGLSWGMGHALALVAVTAGVWLVGIRMPTGWDAALEGAVGLLLVGMGARNVMRARAQMAQGPAVRHAHFGIAHRHKGPAGHVHIGPIALATPSLAVGLLHGLAGSGALAILVAANATTRGEAVGYAAAFGAGAAFSMGGVTWIITVGVARLARWQAAVTRWALLTSGIGALAIGTWWLANAV